MKFSSLLAIEYADAIKARMSQISAASSGLLVESTIHLIPDEMFDGIRAFMDVETSEDHIPIADFLHELVNYLAVREQRKLTLDVYMVGICNLWWLFSYEGLRRKGIMEYQPIENVFEESTYTVKLTAAGCDYVNNEHRDMCIM